MFNISKRLYRSIIAGVVGTCTMLIVVVAAAASFGCDGYDVSVGFLCGVITMGIIAIYIQYNPLPVEGGK